MTNKWSKGDLAALDALLDKFPPTEIAAKAKQRTHRSAGRPGHIPYYHEAVFQSIEVVRDGGKLSIREAAEEIAAVIARKWKKPISAKSLVGIHRKHCRERGISPTGRRKNLQRVAESLRAAGKELVSTVPPDLRLLPNPISHAQQARLLCHDVVFQTFLKEKYRHIWDNAGYDDDSPKRRFP